MDRKRIAIALMFSILTFMVITGSGLSYELPEGLIKITEYNQQYITDFVKDISLPIAFLAGILSFLSPCILPFLPAYFSYTFKEKTSISKMTMIFFSGFSSVFVLMGLGASYLGKTLAMFQQDYSVLIVISGIFILIFGIMSFFGKGFSSLIKNDKKRRDDPAGVFMFGMFFAIGWTACLGPILAGILSIATILGNYYYAGLLMLSYSLGIFVPLIVMSVLYDRLNLSQNKLFKGRQYKFDIFGKHIELHSGNIISGLLLMLVGIVFILYQGTYLVNSFDPAGTKQSFYDLQNYLISIPDIYFTIINYIGYGIVLILAYRLISKMRKK